MLKKIDVKAGDLTYGQRIGLGKVLEAKLDEYNTFLQMLEVMTGEKVTLTIGNRFEYVQYFKEILDGLTFWVEKEKELLDYEPTPEEKKAGIVKLSEKLGPYGTIKALAKAYSQDPDTIVKEWKYGKVFGLIYTDLEEHKYKERLNKIIQEKYKRKGGRK